MSGESNSRYGSYLTASFYDGMVFSLLQKDSSQNIMISTGDGLVIEFRPDGHIIQKNLGKGNPYGGSSILKNSGSTEISRVITLTVRNNLKKTSHTFLKKNNVYRVL